MQRQRPHKMIYLWSLEQQNGKSFGEKRIQESVFLHMD